MGRARRTVAHDRVNQGEGRILSMRADTSDAARVAWRALDELPLAETVLHEAYFLSSLSLCVLDAVFSIGVTYESTTAVVRRYCEAYRLTRLRRDRSRPPERH